MAYDYFVYILSNWKGTVLYVGVTNNLERRLYEHRHGSHDGFTKKYNADKLVYCEVLHEVSAAIGREKQIKGWTRDKNSIDSECESLLEGSKY